MKLPRAQTNQLLKFLRLFLSLRSRESFTMISTAATPACVFLGSRSRNSTFTVLGRVEWGPVEGRIR